MHTEPHRSKRKKFHEKQLTPLLAVISSFAFISVILCASVAKTLRFRIAFGASEVDKTNFRVFL